MSSKINQSRLLSAFSLGMLVSSLAVTNVMAGECGQAKLVEAGSAGVSVSHNACQESSRITLGSVLELSSGSRMWLKFDPSSKGESFQLICQNKSAEAVSVNLTNTRAPWIEPQGLKSCNPWKNNKLSCESGTGEKNSFFCAIASTKPQESAHVPQMTTSVKVRGLDDLIKAIKPDPVEDIIKAITPDVELCKSLYNVSENVVMSWTVSQGIIKNLNINSDNKDLVACVEAVAKQANANQDLSVKHSF